MLFAALAAGDRAEDGLAASGSTGGGLADGVLVGVGSASGGWGGLSGRVLSTNMVVVGVWQAAAASARNASSVFVKTDRVMSIVIWFRPASRAIVLIKCAHWRNEPGIEAVSCCQAWLEQPRTYAAGRRVVLEIGDSRTPACRSRSTATGAHIVVVAALATARSSRPLHTDHAATEFGNHAHGGDHLRRSAHGGLAS